jgi:hypothetical protein
MHKPKGIILSPIITIIQHTLLNAGWAVIGMTLKNVNIVLLFIISNIHFYNNGIQGNN